MEDIIIRNEDEKNNTWSVEQGDKESVECGWDEMLGLVAALTMPDKRPCLNWMKPKSEEFGIVNGDFVFMPCGANLTYIAIYEGIWDEMVKGYAITDKEDVRVKDANMCPFEFFHEDSVDYIRKATEEEKQLLLSKLHEIGKDWDEEKKEIVDWKWEPNKGEEYYFPKFRLDDGGFVPSSIGWDGMDVPFDKAHYDKNWLFRTKEECKPLCDKLNEAIKKVKQ